MTQNIKNNEETNTNKKRNIIMIILFLLLLAGVSAIGYFSINATETPVIEEITAEEAEVVEEEVEETPASEGTTTVAPTKKAVVKAAPSQATTTTTTQAAPAAPSTTTQVEETKTEDIPVLTVMTTVKNPTIVVGEKEVNASLFGVKASLGDKDITSTCSISLDKTKVNMSVSGSYDVTISVNCGQNGNASRMATVTIYVPKKDEAPKAESKTDTSSASTTPVVETTRDTKEMTKVTIQYADGTRVTFVKNEVENVYATQVNRVIFEEEIPSNYIIDGNTLTINGKVFTAR